MMSHHFFTFSPISASVGECYFAASDDASADVTGTLWCSKLLVKQQNEDSLQ
jgi:hypothetical protein